MKRLVRKLSNREDGFTLIEVIFALAIMSIIAIALFSALGTSQLTTSVSNEQATAHNLAEGQMEYVKGLEWNPDGYLLDEIPSDYSGYSVTIDPNPPALVEENMQKIVLKVYHHGEEVMQMEGYKLR